VNLLLVEIKTQRDLRMLQIVVAAAGVGLIGTGWQDGEKNGEQACDAE
jgi:hypothetical protein